MNNKTKYYPLDDIGFIGSQVKEYMTKEEKKAISDFIAADKLKNNTKSALSSSRKIRPSQKTVSH